MYPKSHPKTARGASIYVARHNECEIVSVKIQTIKKDKRKHMINMKRVKAVIIKF